MFRRVITLRIPRRYHQAIQTAARAAGVSINTWLVKSCLAQLDQHPDRCRTCGQINESAAERCAGCQAILKG